MSRDKTIALRLTEDEKKLIDDYAKKLSTPSAVLVRQVVMREVSK